MTDRLPPYLFVSRLRELTRAFRDKIHAEFEFMDKNPEGYDSSEAVRQWRSPLMDFVMAFDQLCEATDPNGDDPVLSMLASDKDRVAGIRTYFEHAILELIRSDHARSAIEKAVQHFTDACKALRAWQMEQFPGLKLQDIAAVEQLDSEREIACLDHLKRGARDSVKRAIQFAKLGNQDKPGNQDTVDEDEQKWARDRIVALCVAARRLFLVTRIGIAATPDCFLDGDADREILTELKLHKDSLETVEKLAEDYGKSDLSSLCIRSIEDRIQWLESQTTPQELVKAVTSVGAESTTGTGRYRTGGRTQ